MKEITLSTDEEFTIINIGPLTRAEVYNAEHNLTGVGHARWNPDDVYNEKFGIDLAVARATNRLTRKLEKRLARGPQANSY